MLAVGALFVGSCTEAQFATPVLDAGAECEHALCVAERPDAASDDASSPVVDDTLPLLGRYAVHTRFYGRELSTGLFKSLHELFVIANITRGPSGLKMRVTTCQDRGQIMADVGLSTNVAVKYPEHFPERDFDLVVDGDSFYTTGAALAIGYTQAAPVGCSPGAQIPSDERWVRDRTCNCPVVSAPPDDVDECRVIDSDGDGNPGMSVVSTGLINATEFVRISDSSQYVNGVVAKDTKRHRANFLKQEDYRSLVCATGDCSTPGVRWCQLTQQPVTFIPLEDEEVTCKELLRRIGNNQLFSGESLDGSFPAGC